MTKRELTAATSTTATGLGDNPSQPEAAKVEAPAHMQRRAELKRIMLDIYSNSGEDELLAAIREVGTDITGDDELLDVRGMQAELDSLAEMTKSKNC